LKNFGILNLYITKYNYTMPNNPRKEARVAAREVRKDERREKRQGKAYASFLKEGEREKKQLEKKRTPAEIKQLIDEIPPGMRPPWMNSYGTPTTTTPPSTMKRGGATTKKKYMTGGMTNANAKVSALVKAGSNGVMSGVNPKAKPSAKATGKTGGTSKAPKEAKPKKIKKG
jgi:hypothetical protein